MKLSLKIDFEIMQDSTIFSMLFAFGTSLLIALFACVFVSIQSFFHSRKSQKNDSSPRK